MAPAFPGTPPGSRNAALIGAVAATDRIGAPAMKFGLQLDDAMIRKYRVA